MSTTLVPRLIQTDIDTQIRIEISDDVVKDYVEAMEAGDIFPPFLFTSMNRIIATYLLTASIVWQPIAAFVRMMRFRSS
ncbi:MAG: hypothetical protein LBG58_06695 [Planctomycetaceae bacterium]|jgi:hypothetical protein|nr:hypothetical protein [Planctomycetaceae bacterium]